MGDCSSKMPTVHYKQNAIYSYSYATTQKKFNAVYFMGEEIGSGSCAIVNKCFRKSDSKEFAVKVTKKSYLTQKELISLKDEIRILKHTSHNNIIKLIDVFDNGKTVLMVLELCNETDLLDKIIDSQQHKFSETQSAEIIYDLSVALNYLHNNGIVHRDLKLENILFSTDGTIKVADFGLAHIADTTSDSIRMDSCCGTPRYVAPEVIKQTKQYTSKCDLWSLGVILYVMLVGYEPFQADSLDELYKLIVKGKYNFNGKKWRNVSSDAKHLIQCLLETDPEKRYNAKDIQYHPWINRHVSVSKRYFSNGVWGMLVPVNMKYKPILIKSDMFTIGRAPNQDLILSETTVSSKHCVIVNNNVRNKILLRDSSKNGTYINGKSIKVQKNENVKETWLNNGDIISFGVKYKPEKFAPATFYYFHLDCDIASLYNNMCNDGNNEFNVRLNMLHKMYYWQKNINKFRCAR